MDDPMNKLEEWWATEGFNLSHKDACIAAFKLGLSVYGLCAATETSESATNNLPEQLASQLT